MPSLLIDGFQGGDEAPYQTIAGAEISIGVLANSDNPDEETLMHLLPKYTHFGIITRTIVYQKGNLADESGVMIHTDNNFNLSTSFIVR